MSDANATPAQPARPDRDLHTHVVAVLSTALLMSVRSSRTPHAVQLDALLSAYVTELDAHPCCHKSAADGLRGLADQFEQKHTAHVAAIEQAAQQAAQAIAQAARPAA